MPLPYKPRSSTWLLSPLVRNSRLSAAWATRASVGRACRAAHRHAGAATDFVRLARRQQLRPLVHVHDAVHDGNLALVELENGDLADAHCQTKNRSVTDDVRGKTPHAARLSASRGRAGRRGRSFPSKQRENQVCTAHAQPHTDRLRWFHAARQHDDNWRLGARHWNGKRISSFTITTTHIHHHYHYHHHPLPFAYRS